MLRLFDPRVGGEVTTPMEASSHEPVLVDRIIDLLAVADGPGIIVDATIGMGGHAVALLAASADDVALVGFDRDPEALALAGRRLAAFRARVHLVHVGYDELSEWVGQLTPDHGPVLAVLYDLGVSSLQLDRADRGFSFRHDAPLDMRMDPTGSPTAADVVNTATVDELRDMLRTYGEERHAGRIARAIVTARPLHTTGELAEVVASAMPPGARSGARHPATRTFQALRIAVNDELARFRASLPQALELAAPTTAHGRGGRVAVLSYHSLEDRIAKRTFADAITACVCPPDLPVCGCGRRSWARALFRGVVRPDDAEVARNPRARSAKLRAIEMTAPGPMKEE
ncbi:MAG TPA: 16S rRNA (cytosine(1402)-N(4))-methyltransferase RsmH [Euzebyales bacterium]|nr:16S rRNA (cytosine(1402)-N(4))-methyltransferase RsmH [Euzebyales bacterium]